MVTYRVAHTGPISKPHSPSRITVEVPKEMTVRELVDYLLERGDAIGTKAEFDGDAVKQYMVIVNAMHLRVAGGPDLVLKDGDTIAILVPFVGG